MQIQTSAARTGIVVAAGYGLKIYVQRGHLVVHDGIGADRQTRRFNRATSKLKRLIVLGRSGYITFDATRWLRDIGAAFFQFDADGSLVSLSAARGSDVAALRRAQALARSEPSGLEVARELLAAKVGGQRALLDELPGGRDHEPVIHNALEQIEVGSDLATLLRAEARAADAYWDAWSSLPLPFSASAMPPLPEHWRTFGQRASLLTSGPRLATNPAGATLNYLYALLEAETTVACHTVGLDPGLGIFHIDRRDRDSLALDIVEAARPAVDAYVLALLTQRTLSPRNFVETRRGACRLSARYAAKLAGTVALWRRQIAPVVEGVAHRFAAASADHIRLTTPLTRANHRAAWEQRAGRPRDDHATETMPALPASCRDCGAEISDHRHRHCDACRRRRFEVQARRGRRAAARVLAQLRAEQRDPAHGGDAAKARGRKNAAHQQAVKQWRGPMPDPLIFRTEILPGLRDRTIRELVAITGLSEHYCSLIRLGKKVPHARHWDTLRALTS